MALALTQDKYLAIGKKKQADLVTALVAADMLTLAGTQIDLQARPINEDNAADLGKGVYATNVYPSHIEASGSWNGRVTAEALAFLSGYAIGAVSKSSSGDGFKYTMTAPDLETDGLDLPVTTIATKTGAVNNKALIGMACEEFGIQLQSGPGRDNAQFTSSWVGTGQYDNPSGISFPAAFTEHSLTSGSLNTLTLIGFDYLTSGRMNQVNIGFKNNIRPGFYPGSGAQDNYQLQGRMRRGVPSITLTAKVEADSASSEEDALLAGTEGTGVIYLRGAALGAAYYGWKITFHRIRLRATPLGDADGIATYDCEYTVLKHASNGVFTIEATIGVDNFLTAAS